MFEVLQFLSLVLDLEFLQNASQGTFEFLKTYLSIAIDIDFPDDRVHRRRRYPQAIFHLLEEVAQLLRRDDPIARGIHPLEDGLHLLDLIWRDLNLLVFIQSITLLHSILSILRPLSRHVQAPFPGFLAVGKWFKELHVLPIIHRILRTHGLHWHVVIFALASAVHIHWPSIVLCITIEVSRGVLRFGLTIEMMKIWHPIFALAL